MPDPIQQLAGCRILVVEDDCLVGMIVKDMLEEAGAEVMGPVPGLGQALALAEEGGIDAAVLDVNLGEGETSFPLADRLAALGVPFLFATGNPQAAACSAHRDRPRLPKPFRELDLVDAVERLAGSAAPRCGIVPRARRPQRESEVRPV